MAKVGHGPMLAKLEPEIPRGPGWTYEPKWDGFRTIVTVGDEITLESRDGPADEPVLPGARRDARGADGTDRSSPTARSSWCGPGSLSFDELQLRLHPAESRVRKLADRDPRHADPLRPARGGRRRSSDEAPLAERRERLAKLCASLHVAQAPEDLDELDPGPDLLLTPWTDDLERRGSDGSRTRPGSARTASSRSGTTSRTFPAPAAG